MSNQVMNTPIGVFDSGIGGLSILRALRAQMPAEQFVYYADTAHNPYGDKSDAFVMERSLAIAHELVQEQGIKALVVACNTATAAAIGLLREAYPDLPIVGIEPALKPAALLTRTGRVAVLATRGTLQSAKFAALRDSLRSAAGRVDIEFVCTPCEGLAQQIEAVAMKRIDTTELIAASAYFIRTCGLFGIKKGEIDTLVLGCTHYPLIAPIWRNLVGPDVQIVDNAQAVALRSQELLVGRLQTSGAGQIRWISSGDAQQLEHAATYWLKAV